MLKKFFLGFSLDNPSFGLDANSIDVLTDSTMGNSTSTMVVVGMDG